MVVDFIINNTNKLHVGEGTPQGNPVPEPKQTLT